MKHERKAGPVTDLQNEQRAPYPEALAEMVKTLELPTRPGWHVGLRDMDRGQGSSGLTLVILIIAPNTYRASEMIRVQHLMPVPPAAYDARSWRRWLFEQLRLVDLHELMEGFVIDGRRPYAPSHGPGNDPYLVREPEGTDIDVRTSFRGELNPEIERTAVDRLATALDIPPELLGGGNARAEALDHPV